MHMLRLYRLTVDLELFSQYWDSYHATFSVQHARTLLTIELGAIVKGYAGTLLGAYVYGQH